MKGLQVSYDKLKDWLRDAEPKDRIVYFVGDLASTRQDDPNVNKVANLLTFEEEDGEVYLFQKRVKGEMHYVASRRG